MNKDQIVTASFERLSPSATLGSIATAVEEARSALGGDEGREAFWGELWLLYDTAYAHRPDYRLWRLKLKRILLPPEAKSWETPATLLQAALDEPNVPAIPWGASAILANLLDGWMGKIARKEALTLLTQDTRARVATLRPIRWGELKCEVIRERILASVPELDLENDPIRKCELELDKAERFLDMLEPDWRRRGTVRCELGNRNVAPFHDAILESFIGGVLSIRLGRYLKRVKQVSDFSDATEVLLARADKLARVAWHLCRHNTRGWLLRPKGNHRSENAQTDQEKRFPSAFERKNVEALKHLVYTSSDTANSEMTYFRTVALAHLCLCMDLEGLNWDFANRFAWRVRQAGLGISGAHSDLLNREHVRRARKPRKFNPYWNRIHHDRSNLREWAKLDERFGVWKPLVDDCPTEDAKHADYDPVDVLRYLAHAAENRQLNDPPTLRSAMRLAQHYAFTTWAAKLLGALGANLTQADLLGFAHHLKRAQQVLPLGHDHQEQQEWQGRLRKAWSTLALNEDKSGPAVLVLHEVLLGRSLQLLRRIEAPAAKLIAMRYNDLLPETLVRVTIAQEPTITAYGPPTANAESLIGFLRRHEVRGLGAPVCCSLVWIGGDRFHLLAAGIAADSQPVWFSENKELPGIIQHAELMRVCPRDWLVENSDGSTGLEIDWGEGFPSLMRRFAALVRSWRIQPSWLVLAVESRLASLPWNHLAQRHWPGSKKPLVSLVPSLGWAALTSAEPGSYSCPFHLRLSVEVDRERQQNGEPDLGTLRSRIVEAERERPWILDSTAIVTGHGAASSSDIPAIDANGVMRAEEWIEIGDSRLVMLHSCFGGHTEPKHLGDLGGVPSLTLGVQTRLLCAPVAEVPIETALCLNDRHLAADGVREFGARYWAALERDPRVSLYNLYGLLDERVG